MTRSEAARALSVPMSTISRFIKTGVLEPMTSKPQLFQLEDVNALRPLIEDKVHISKIWNYALHANLRAKRLEKRLDLLMEMLRVGSHGLSTAEKDVRALFSKIYRTGKSDQVFLASEVLDWAKTLLAIDEHYLIIAAKHLRTAEPWQQLLWFSQHLLAKAPQDMFKSDRGLEAAYGYLGYAHRHLRQVAYFYCRALKGAKEAGLRIPEVKSGDVTKEISYIVATMLTNEAIAKH